MGCLCAKPHYTEGQPRSPLEVVGIGTSSNARTGDSSKDPSDKTLTVREVLELANHVVSEYFEGQLDAIPLAAIALIESSGRVKAVTYRIDIGDASIGLCQLHLSTAKWLSSVKNFDKFGIPEKHDLEDPRRSLYYGAAYLSVLASGMHEESELLNEPINVEEYVVRAYHAGPKLWKTTTTDVYWAKYVRAKHLLRKLQDALTACENCKTGTTMHVVHQGETLARIAQVCGVGVEDIVAANPDIPDCSAIQPNDCIALPVAVVLPQMYVVKPGDTLQSVAKQSNVSLHRLLAKNPEVKDASVFAPGWVLLLPGLRGETSSLGGKSDIDRNTCSVSHWSPPRIVLTNVPGLQQQFSATTVELVGRGITDIDAQTTRTRSAPVAEPVLV